MKELNRMLSRYLERVKRSHRYLAVLVVLSLVVTFIVPLGLIENADSKTGQLICGMIEHTHNAECDYGTNCTITPHTHTEDCYRKVTLLSAAGSTTAGTLQNAAGEDGNIVETVIYSPKNAELLTLLFGKNNDDTPLDWLKDATTLDEALSAAEDEYFLGMASDFCAFIEGDFIPTDADAEGRVAVGGNLMFQQTGTNIWNYQIASGDYQSMTPIQQTGPYEGITGFASALVGGKMFRINTLSTGNKSQVAGTLATGHTSGDTVYYTPEVGGFKSFVVGNITASRHWDGDNSQDIAYSTGCHHDYPSDCAICASDPSQHEYLASVNELAQMYEYTDVRQIITKVFSEVRNRSQALSQINSTPGVVDGNTVVLKYTGPEDVDTVYFAVDSWNEAWNGVDFQNIPTKDDGTPVNIIVNCGGNEVKLYGDGNNFATTINGTGIGNQANSGKNNHEWSSCLLYNFYEATKMTLNGNFNGTVLAPNADVESSSDKCSGHLSGALIAKSFYGGLEFGYRPYRGGSDILGLVSGYAAPVDKLDGEGAFLSGAELKVEQSLDDGNTFQTFMEHISDSSTWWIPFQSLIDYSGKTDYQPKISGNDTMTIDDTQTLTISNGSGTIDLQGGSWSSSAESIATVDDHGTVTAVGTGEVTIAFTVGGKSFEKKITVNYKPLAMNTLPSELYEGESIDLSDKVTGGSGNYTWSITAGDDAASVSGTAFTTKDISANTTVTLCVTDTETSQSIDQQITVKPLVMTPANGYSMVPDSSQALNITAPEGMVYTVTSSNTEVATVADGTVHSLAKGTTTISLLVNGTSYVSFTLTVDTAPITINGMPTAIYEGESIDLSGMASGGNGTFTWSVDNSVATITAENKLYANTNIDTATSVTLTVTDTDGKTATHPVTIQPLVITTGSTMVSGGEYDLKLNSDKQGEYTWTSDSESVTISGTKATAVSEATDVTIRVSKDGVTYATLTVNVIAASAQLQFNSSLPTAVFEGETISLEGMLTGGSGSLAWNSSNESVAKVEGSQIITYNVESDTEVTITVTDANDSTNTATYSFQIKAVSITATNTTITVNGSPDTTQLTITEGAPHSLTSSDTSNAYVTFDAANLIATAKAAGTVAYSLQLNGTTYASVNITVKPEAGTVQLPITVAKGETQEIPFDTSKIPVSIELNVTRLGDNNWWCGFNIYVYDVDGNTLVSPWGTVENSNVTLSLASDSTNSREKIKIVSNDGSNGSFAINSYTITYADGTTGTYTTATHAASLVARAKGIRRVVSRSTEESMTQTFTQLYRITETAPPDGYFGDATAYIVKVTETIDLTQLKTDADSCFPMSTVTKMAFYKKTTEGETLLYTVDLQISDAYGNNKTNTRTITIGDDTFVMTIDSDKGAITKLSVKGTEQTEISLTEPSIITVGEQSYRFDPAHMMVVPVPATKATFVNTAGVLFKKVDDVNETLTDAIIRMYQLVDGDWKEVDADLFDANAVKSNGATMLKLDTYLATAGEYIFKLEETKVPTGYQIAAPIYFKISVADDLTATYAISSDNATWTALEKQNGYYTISMVDKPQYGIKLSLQKIDGTNTEIMLQGAKFALYAADHTLVYPTDYPGSEDHLITTGADGMVDLSTLFEANPTLADSQYVREGFLKAGNYYFKEIVPPTRTVTDDEGNTSTIEYALPNQTFAFTVKKKTNGTYELKVETSSKEHGYTTVKDSEGNDHQALLITAAGLAKVTDEMITNGTTILTITYDTSNSQQVNEHWGNAKFSGLYDTGTKESSNVTINSTSETVSLTARQMLEKLGISFTDDTLITEFRKLEQFIFEVWNSTTITDYAYLTTPSPQAYDFKTIGWSADGDGTPSVAITELTLYYLNGTTATINDVGYTSHKQWWAPLDLSGFDSMNDVVGVKLVAGGSGTNNIQFKIGDSEAVWGNDEYGNISISAGQTYTFGDTSGTAYAVPEPVIQIANTPLEDKMDFSVEKHWLGDSDFLTMRPDKIQVQLYRTTDQNDTTNAESVGDAVDLTETGDWTYLWTELPRQSDAGEAYYYFVKEVENATLSSRYTIDYGGSQPSNLGGVYVINNTLKTAELPVTKTWDTTGYKNVDTPDILRLQLQWNLGTNEEPDWQDVSGKVLILRNASGWKGKFENLPVGYTYRVVELNLPYGWTMSQNDPVTLGGDSETSQSISLKNTFTIDQGSLSVSKTWDNDSESERPESITLNLYQSVIAQSGTYSDITYGDDPESVQNDYARLLQYSLYFYDANMCGENAQENSAVSWRGNCHIEDEVQGGYHDAGDHVMFGLAQGYAASTLGWGYYAFKDEYKDLGQDKHYEIIMKQFCDFFVEATELNADGTVKRMLYQKGNGDIDHAYWGAPENQDDRSAQMYWTTNGASDVAAEYAAALALQYLNFPDDSDRDEYLKYAKALFAFSTKYNQKVGAEHTGFYDSDSVNDDQAWAAGWLCLADPDNKDYYNTWLNKAGDPWCHCWNNVNVGAAYLQGVVNNNWDKMKGYLSITNNNGYYYADAWGSARYNAAGQLAALTTAKALKDSDSDFATKCYTWAQGQMDMLLGNNTWNDGKSVCLVTGFASNSAQWAHHRAASGYDSDAEFEVNSTYDDDGHVLIGGLVGGPAFKAHSDQNQLVGYPELMKSHEYIDHVQDYCCNEVSIDYNAGLVGAAAGLYSFYQTGELSTTIEGIETVYLPDDYNGNSNSSSSSGSGSSSSGSTSAGASETLTSLDPSALSYTAVDGSCQVKVTLPVPAQNATPRYIYLTGDALGLEGVTVNKIQFEFTSSNFGGTNGAVYLNGTEKKYDSSNTTVTYDTPTTIEALKVDSWWRNADDLQVKITIDVPISDPTILNVPQSLALNGSVQLIAVGFTSTDGITWSSSDTDILSVDSNGKVTATAYGKATITATKDGEQATATIEVKPPLSIDKTDLSSGSTAKLTSVEGVTYTASPEGIVTIDESGKVTPVEGKAGTVAIYATLNGATSDAVQVTVRRSLGGTDVIGTNSRKDMDEVVADALVGLATWSVEASDDYTITKNAGGTVITVKQGDDTLLTLNTQTGVVCTYDAVGTVTLIVTDSANDASGKVELTVKQTSCIAEIPTLRTNLIGKIHLTKNGATLDLIDGAGMNTDSIQLSAESATAAWSAVLENLCQYDEMGNAYYYYIEEAAVNGSAVEDGRFTSGSTQYIVSGYKNNGTMLNAADAASVSVTNTGTGEVQRPLPSAGGEGKANIYVVGVFLMLLSGAGIIGLKRRQRSQR